MLPFLEKNIYLCTKITQCRVRACTPCGRRFITKTYMRKIFSLLVLALLSLCLHAQEASVSSPDGRLRLTATVNGGHATYSLTYDGMSVLADSPVGFVASMGDFSEQLQFVSADSSRQHIAYSMTRTKQSRVEKDCNTLVVTLRNNQQREFDVRFCVSDNDVAFRYELPAMPDPEHGKKRSVRIMRETTGFRFAENTTTFLCPQSTAMIGWKRTKPSYEEDYAYDAPMTSKSKFGKGYTFPCLFRTPCGEKNIWTLVSETGVSSKYCASHLSDYKGEGLYMLDFPMPEENNGNGTVEPAFSLPGSTPWRTITVGTSLKPVVETTVAWDHVSPLYSTEHDYKFGKGTWSWIVWQDPSINYDDQVAYIRLAKAMGYQYVLIDNWWDKNIGRDGLERLVRYANSMGVDVFLWHSSSGYWNDIEQGPINLMDNSIVRKRQMRWLRKIGVKGIKVDFFGGDKQETMRLYEDILSDADDHGLMVIFHGCTLPRGWERMYPNFVGAEAVLASENLYFSQHYCDHEAENTATHAYIRNAVACMEFGGSFLNRVIGRGNKNGNTRRTTDCHSLAQAVMFQNAMQFFALTPENLESSPAVCLDFMRTVPTVWDETCHIDGYPGKYCVIARRSGETWYIAGNNATGKPLTLTLSLPMLSKGETVTLFSDGKDGETVMSDMKVKNPQKVKITIQNNGAMVIRTKQ